MCHIPHAKRSEPGCRSDGTPEIATEQSMPAISPAARRTRPCLVWPCSAWHPAPGAAFRDVAGAHALDLPKAPGCSRLLLCRAARLCCPGTLSDSVTLDRKQQGRRGAPGAAEPQHQRLGGQHGEAQPRSAAPSPSPAWRWPGPHGSATANKGLCQSLIHCY